MLSKICIYHVLLHQRCQTESEYHNKCLLCPDEYYWANTGENNVQTVHNCSNIQRQQFNWVWQTMTDHIQICSNRVIILFDQPTTTKHLIYLSPSCRKYLKSFKYQFRKSFNGNRTDIGSAFHVLSPDTKGEYLQPYDSLWPFSLC